MGFSVKNENGIIVKGNGESEKIVIPGKTLKKASLTLRAVNHPLRNQIMRLIEEKGSMTVTEIYVKMRLEQSVVSQHLAILRNADILATERQGKYIHYKLNKDRLKVISDLIDDLA